ncbi:MAG: hydroxyethylthiazole kinase, partial [Pseudomonadota bacterium]|nr:hydroxyethylthiazole kinase [Pseudomonadota bacterium]
MSAIATLLPRLRAERPLVHAVTNPVTQLFVADALNAVSARPIMATGMDEIVEISAQAASLLINIGVPQSVEPYAAAVSARKGSKNANKGRGWVFDPVGVGASALRDRIAASLLASKPGPTIIRANAGEVLALAGQAGLTEG